MNDLTKKRISYALRGRKKSATHRKNISQSMRGLSKTDSHRKALSDSLRTYYNNKRLQRS